MSTTSASASSTRSGTSSPPLASSSSPLAQPRIRIRSIDALRGFDMFWILGGDALIHALAKLLPHPVTAKLSEQMRHVDWEGFHFYDLIFPLFVFLVGTSLVFSLGKSLETVGRAATLRKVFWRTAILFLLGVIYNGGWSGDTGQMPRLCGVLQRIALAYCGAAVLYTFCSTRGLAIATVSILVGYWAVMAFVPVPGGTAGDFSEAGNLAAWVDTHYLPLGKYKNKPYDPEGLLSMIPAVATCLLGVFAGLLLKRQDFSARKKVLWLLLAGAALLMLGWGWSWHFPIIKKLWTSSFVLTAAGWSCLLLGLFYGVIDGLKFERWSQPFVWVGMNAITMYLLSAVLSFKAVSLRLTGGPFRKFLEEFRPGLGEVVTASVSILLVFLVARFFYRRQIFFKV